jgi:hypothetical protein
VADFFAHEKWCHEFYDRPPREGRDKKGKLFFTVVPAGTFLKSYFL